jgi:hypothetical protein
MSLRLDQRREIPGAKHVTPSLVSPVEGFGVPSVEVLHPPRQRGLCDAEDDVVMGAEQAVSAALPEEGLDYCRQKAQPAASVNVVEKQSLAVDCASVHVIDAVPNLDAEWPWHEATVGLPSNEFPRRP